MRHYDKEEKELIDSIENNKDWKLADNQEGLKKLMMNAASKQKKSNKITINIDVRDLEKVKIIAAKEGLPYQTYIRSMIHKLVSSN
ncbi:MAG TPA: antitoxin [Lentisphaeria bacterium]|nr:MAG: hypothetical protein A2X47_04860 [Lentisphaerae bacterium GWF2_38_69]HBM16323.1 antitoxin [Lentisphaeria bacterium]